VPLADFETIDVLWIVLSVFLVVVGLALAYLLLRLSGTARRLTLLLQGLEASVIPLVTRVQGTVDRVNLELDNVDRATTSAADAAEAADTAVRAVAMAITQPVVKVSGLARGLATGVSTFVSGGGIDAALEAAREARARREQELASDLRPERTPPLPTVQGAVTEPEPPAPETRETQV
jgi:hypothetical protein